MTLRRSRSLISAIFMVLVWLGYTPMAMPQNLDFRRGDVNGDGQVNDRDACELLRELYAGSTGTGAFPCRDAADANDDSTIDFSDVLYLIAYVLGASGGTPVPIPSPGPTVCGPDPTADTHNCAHYSACGAVSVPVNSHFIRGDCDTSLILDSSDALAILATAFPINGVAPQASCLRACDFDADGAITVADAVRLVGFLFAGGPPPPSPYPGCGTGLIDDCLGCTNGGC